MDVIDFSIRGYNTNECLLDSSRLKGRLEVRNWHPGDRYAPDSFGDAKIKQMFHLARIPLWERQSWPIVSCGEEVIWARKFGVASRLKPDTSTGRVLRIVDVDSFESNPSLPASL